MGMKFYWQIIRSVTKAIFSKKTTRLSTFESPKKGFSLLIISIVIAVFLVLLVGVSWKFWSEKTASRETTNPSSGLFGTMVAFNISDADSINDTQGKVNVLQNGWTEFKKDNSAYQNLLTNLQKVVENRTKLVKTTGFTVDRGSFGYFTWNVIEPQKGQFDWGLTDMYVQGASNAGMKISAVIQPFAGWDQKNTQVKTNCSMLDAAYYDYKAGAPNDLTEYENFLTKTVERYKDNVAVWEIGNEPDANCSGYENNPEAYFNLLKVSSETIKKADPSAKVVNGGASGHSNNSEEISFWTKFFALGGGHYIDYFNLHYNTERSHDAKLDTAAFQEDLTFWNNLMDKNGGKKPLYLTEFGIYSGSPSDQLAGQLLQGQSPAANQPVSAPSSGQSSNQPSNGKCGDGICDAFEKQNSNACPQDCGGGSLPGANPGQLSGQPIQNQVTGQSVQPDQGQALRNVSENEQADLYFKDSVIAFDNGAKMVFIDLIGPGNNVVGSSMAFNTDGQPRLFLTTLKMIDRRISGFSKVEKIADGQYKFTVNDKSVYALWSEKMPAEITGQVTITHIDGSQTIEDAAHVSLSTEPVLVSED